MIFDVAMSFKMIWLHEKRKHHGWLLPIFGGLMQNPPINRPSYGPIDQDSRQMRDPMR